MDTCQHASVGCAVSGGAFCRSHRIETRCCNWTSRDTEESCGGRTALSVAQIQRCMGSFMGISTWSFRVKQKCWCVVALLVSLVQTRTIATGMLPAPPVERAMRCRGGKKGLGHFSFIVLYFPPKPPGRGEATPRRKTLDAVYKWTDGLLMSLPTRCIPVLMLDLNGRLGRPRAEGAGVEGDSATRF